MPSGRRGLADLPDEVLLQVTAALCDEDPPASLLSVTVTCRSLHSFVDRLAWRQWLLSRVDSKSHWAAGDDWKLKVQRFHHCNVSWRRQRLDAHRTAIISTPSNDPRARNRQNREEAVEPFLCLGRQWLLLFLRSEVRVWPTSNLDERLRQPHPRHERHRPRTRGMVMTDAQVVHLTGGDSPTARWSLGAGKTNPNKPHPEKNISACCTLDSNGNTFVVGRVDGTIEQYELPAGLSERATRGKTPRERGSKPAPWECHAPQQLRFEAKLVSTLSAKQGQSRISTGSAVQALSFSGRLLSAVTRGGEVRLYRRDKDAWALVWRLNLGRQCWSCHLDQAHGAPRWLALGSKGTEALFVLPLDPLRHLPCKPVILNTLHTSHGRPVAAKSTQLFEGSKGMCKPSSVFALAQPGPRCRRPLHANMLVAGFYDGVVRVYDFGGLDWADLGQPSRHLLASAESDVPLYPTDTASRGQAAEHPLHTFATLCPSMHFRDRFDGSAIYSLAIPGDGTHLLAGTSTSGSLKVFEVARAHECVTSRDAGVVADEDALVNSLPPGSRAGWSAFAGYPAQSPTFSLVSDVDIVIGVTDKLLFDMALHDHRSQKPQHTASSRDQMTGLAYYCLDTLELCFT